MGLAHKGYAKYWSTQSTHRGTSSTMPGTGALTWALLVLTDGTLSTHTDTVNDRIRYSEYFHAVLRVPAWGTLDARMNDAEYPHGSFWARAWGPKPGTARAHIGY
jgi:hypothetical protein